MLRYTRWLLLMFALPIYGQNADISLLRKIYTPGNQSGDAFFQTVTDTYPIAVAGAPLTVGLIGILTNDKKLQSEALELTTSVLINGGMALATKYIVNRDRPFVTYPDIIAKDVESGPSFPSYHTAAAFNTATSLSLLYPRWYVIAPSYLWASAVGYSRMRLGVHYPSDVAAGAVFGAGSAWLNHRVNKWYQSNQRIKHGKFE